MDFPGFLAHLRAEFDAYEACLSGDLTAPVEHCGDWTLRDLTEHLGRSSLRATVAIEERRGDYSAPAAPRDPGELVQWLRDIRSWLLRALDQDPSVPAWTFRPPHTVGFWQRRRCLETLVHRWDAEHALGIARPLDAELAGEGVAEVFDTMALRVIDRGRASAPSQAIRLVATDTRGSWTYGPGTPVATISATAENLLLMLWGRVPSNDETIAWEGDRDAGQAVLAGPLVP
ncbi:MAG TPA: maleylpyruvate isomerase family mycothiol-dependent enzyme [Actinoallomurus sp.]|nr:maleylpyruvate isomerase family mycothiol-dependent enzyme [Actinoallomurus sp.]